MNENKNKGQLTLDDLQQFKVLFEGYGYTIVNDYELPDDEELGFDITGNEVIQSKRTEPKYFSEDMSHIETYLNGSGYSVVRTIQPKHSPSKDSTPEENSINFCNSYMGEMAFVRTCSSFLALMVSFVITYKVW